ncbi:lactonase family protein [Streptomyces sp. CRN 30]|uniref:lactonase family protein n=1 Tax=Streptomyces sp. CRN 30 TaxID=3075613 RepID=UPI002A840D3B|nr:lactonase family protein [Streptomyces sp. CRN 30]
MAEEAEGAHGRGGRAFIGSFTTAGGPGIVLAAVDAASGALTLASGGASGTDGPPNPSYLALSPGGDLLYAVSETDEGAVAAYRVTGDGLEPAGPPVPVPGAGPTHLGLFDGHVLTADYGSGSVTAVPLRADGTLAQAASGVLRHTGSGPHPERQREPHAHQVQAGPGGRWAVGVDLGTDSVLVYALDDGRPVLHDRTALRPGSGPRHLAFHPGGRYAYVVHELVPVVTVCRWDPAAGALRPLAEVPLLPGTWDGDAYPSGIAVSADGRFVWTATRGQDVLSVLAADGRGEALRLVGTVPCGGHWPRALTASERFLYVANERSGDVTWFAVDPETGMPRRGGSVAVPAASCVVLG